ncbi:MAG TPA: carboxypeptidase regulatory-like domain-containing protein [Pyrinomonadaceae bacterium]
MKTKLLRAVSDRLFVALALASLACVCLAAWGIESPPAHAQAGAAQQEGRRDKTPKAAVYGRVVYEGTNRPVRRARIMLLSPDGRGPEQLMGLTDARGEFRIKGVSAGRYIAAVDVAGVISPISFAALESVRSDFLNFDEIVKNFDVFETTGKADKEVTVRARRGAALGGRVTYSDGEPAVGLTVHLMRKTGGRFAKTLTGFSIGSKTDDRGRFRIAGMPPGEYVVAVSESAQHNEAGEGRSAFFMQGVAEVGGLFGQSLYMTFHPSATTEKAATVIKVGAGDEREDVDITVAERDSRTVAGVVRGRGDRRPVARAMVAIFPRRPDAAQGAFELASLDEVFENGAQTDEEGRWVLKDIPDGSYTIFVKPPDAYEPTPQLFPPDGTAGISNANVTVMEMNTNITVGNLNTAIVNDPPRRVKKYAPARVEVEVAGGDVSELAIELGEGGRVSGTISFEGSRPLPDYVHVHTTRVGKGLSGAVEATASASASAYKGRFTLDGMGPGKYHLHASFYDRDGNTFHLKSITWRGKDLMREPLDIAEGAAVEGVSMVYTSDGATLKVNVRAASEKTAGVGVHVLLVSADAARWSAHDAQQFHCSTRAGDSCEIKAAPGDYAVVVVLTPSSLVGGFEEEVRKRAAGATRVSLRAGETKTVEAAAPEP